jgi:hypothetical protein
VQGIAQQLALPPLVAALAAGATIVAAAVIFAKLLRLLT